MNEDEEIGYRPIIQLKGYVYEITLEDIVRLVLLNEEKPHIFWKDNHLIHYSYMQDKKLREGELHIVKVITMAYFTKIKGFSRWIVYDETENILKYTNDIKNLHWYGSTKRIDVLKSPDTMAEYVYEAIKKH